MVQSKIHVGLPLVTYDFSLSLSWIWSWIGGKDCSTSTRPFMSQSKKA